MAEEEEQATWSEENSQTFVDLGRYVVPDRELQIEIIGDLVPPGAGAFHILELCCGEGLLADALLERFPDAVVHGYDGSLTMLQHARVRLARFGARFGDRLFDLAAEDWRDLTFPVRAVVSSLAIHHLDGPQKQKLYAAIYTMLEPGGALIIADLIEPAGAPGTKLAAKLWDRAVVERAQQLDGTTAAVDAFRQQQWNLYEYPDPLDKPSRLLDNLRWLEEAGFTEADVYWLKAGHAIYGASKPSLTN